MIRLYNKLSEYGVTMSMMADNEYKMVHIQFEKGAARRCCVYTYEMACDPIRWQDMLISHLGEFIFIYEQGCMRERK